MSHGYGELDALDLSFQPKHKALTPPCPSLLTLASAIQSLLHPEAAPVLEGPTPAMVRLKVRRQRQGSLSPLSPTLVCVPAYGRGSAKWWWFLSTLTPATSFDLEPSTESSELCCLCGGPAALALHLNPSPPARSRPSS